MGREKQESWTRPGSSEAQLADFRRHTMRCTPEWQTIEEGEVRLNRTGPVQLLCNWRLTGQNAQAWRWRRRHGHERAGRSVRRGVGGKDPG